MYAIDASKTPAGHVVTHPATLAAPAVSSTCGEQQLPCAAPVRSTRAQHLGIAQVFTDKSNEVLSLRIDEVDGLLVGVTEFEEVIGNVESG